MAALPPNEPPLPENDPSWLTTWKLQATGALPPTQPTDPQRTPTGRWQAGTSGNPAGNSRGAKTKAGLLREQFENAAEGVRQVVIDCALKGDMQAAALVLARCVAPLRPAREKTPFRLDVREPLAAQAAAVVQAVADGELAAADAQIVMACLSTYAAIKQADEIEGRLAALEGAASISRARGGIIEMEDMHAPNR